MIRITDARLHKYLLKAMLPFVLHSRYLVRGGQGDPRLVCVSFDCENHDDIRRLPSLLDLLKELEITTSFALRGDMVSQNPNLTRRILLEGHEIVNHTFSHPHKFSQVEEQRMRSEVESFQQLLRSKFDYSPKGFRAPHLMRRYDKKLFRILQQNGLYDSSYVGVGVSVIGNIVELPLTACPDHSRVCFDYWHHFQLPLIASTNEQFLKLWQTILKSEHFVNIFLDPRLTSDAFLFEVIRQIPRGRSICRLSDAAEASGLHI